MKDPEKMYHHKYSEGDFIISDNLAVGHEASEDTQRPRTEVQDEPKSQLLFQ